MEKTPSEQLVIARETLYKTINDLKVHMISKHGGIMATSCHFCMSKKLIIDDNKMFIKEAEKKSK